MKRTLLLSALPACLLLLGWMGCSDGDGTDLGQGGTAANGSGANASGGSAASGGGTGEGGVAFDAGDNDGNTLQDGDVCGTTEADALLIELDMFLVIDQSGSMNPQPWGQTETALNAFFNNPLSEGINVGLSFFPHPQLGSSCDPGFYNPIYHPNPIPPLAQIPADNATLQSVLASMTPGGMTPMRAALEGTYQVATAWQDSYPEHKVIVVLSGDGMPNSCESNTSEEIAVSSGLATAALNQNGVETYCVILEASAASALNQIAAAGGTGQAFDVSQDVSQFAQVMNDIREDALGCEYIIPEPEPGEPFDPMQVNVYYYAGGGDDATLLPKADNEADCGNDAGWYYDDPVDPTMILLCPASCATVEGDPEARISIAFGCPTQAN